MSQAEYETFKKFMAAATQFSSLNRISKSMLMVLEQSYMNKHQLEKWCQVGTRLIIGIPLSIHCAVHLKPIYY